MSNPEKPLNDVFVVYTDFGKQPPLDLTSYVAVTRAVDSMVVEVLEDHGATCLPVPYPNLQDDRDALKKKIPPDATTYILKATDLSYGRGKLNTELFDSGRMEGLARRPEHFGLDEAGFAKAHTLLAAEQAVMFTAAMPDVGHCIYRLREPWQLARLQQAYADHGALLAPIGGDLQEFIPPVSDRYTSFRVVTTATGEIVAAGLFASSQTTQEAPPTIQFDRFDKVEAMAAKYSRYRDILVAKRLFEDPASPYFLAAEDVRSNIAVGGKSFQLMGPGAVRVLDPTDRKLLAAHRIDPDHPALPTLIAGASRPISEFMGQRLGLLLGIDFMLGPKGEVVYLETNLEPDLGAVQGCYPEHKALIDAYTFTMDSAVDGLVRAAQARQNTKNYQK